MRTVFVKANTDIFDVDSESKLSVGDRIVSSMPINLTFFYDYVISEETLEEALQKIADRYPEVTGRLAFAIKFGSNYGRS